MFTTTIALEMDAYEKLRSSMQPGETFSDVVRRASFGKGPCRTGAELLEYYRTGGSGVSLEYLDSVEEAMKAELPPDHPWA